jgi:hypothetical protein
MRSRKHGSGISPVEVFQVSKQGFWLYLEAASKEYFLSFHQFPWFQDATYRQLSSVSVEHNHILSWPELDVDLDLERIEHPERFPLVARIAGARSKNVRKQPKRRKAHAGQAVTASAYESR